MERADWPITTMTLRFFLPTSSLRVPPTLSSNFKYGEFRALGASRSRSLRPQRSGVEIPEKKSPRVSLLWRPSNSRLPRLLWNVKFKSDRRQNRRLPYPAPPLHHR
uniref:Uncharacterized protein n=1 Tax=Ixodes ricinus TaxID=34613 RepID=A0A6B0UBG7_IXORI